MNAQNSFAKTWEKQGYLIVWLLGHDPNKTANKMRQWIFQGIFELSSNE